MKSAARRGFTLLEVMVVIVITGILATIGISNYLDSLDNAKNSEVVSNESIVRMALENYGSDNDGSYPSGPASGTAGWNGGTSTMHSGLTVPAFHDYGYLQGNQLPLSPWCKLAQTADIPDTLVVATWAQIESAASARTLPAGWSTGVTSGAIKNPPDSDCAWGALRYWTAATATALGGNCGTSTKVYWILGVGKRGNKRIVVGPYSNTLQ